MKSDSIQSVCDLKMGLGLSRRRLRHREETTVLSKFETEFEVPFWVFVGSNGTVSGFGFENCWLVVAIFWGYSFSCHIVVS